MIPGLLSVSQREEESRHKAKNVSQSLTGHYSQKEQQILASKNFFQLLV